MSRLQINLNTSHVLIYHIHPLVKSLHIRFKYISCSYLSDFDIYDYIASKLFKYISCSYLSLTRTHVQKVLTNLNTSHVLIYPTNLYEITSALLNLNTSHVLIYRIRSRFSLLLAG